MVGTLCTKWWHTLYQALAHFKKSEAKIWVFGIFFVYFPPITNKDSYD